MSVKEFSKSVGSNLEHLHLTWYCVDINYVRWKMSAPHISLSYLTAFVPKIFTMVVYVHQQCSLLSTSRVGPFKILVEK